MAEEPIHRALHCVLKCWTQLHVFKEACWPHIQPLWLHTALCSCIPHSFPPVIQTKCTVRCVTGGDRLPCPPTPPKEQSLHATMLHASRNIVVQVAQPQSTWRTNTSGHLHPYIPVPERKRKLHEHLTSVLKDSCKMTPAYSKSALHGSCTLRLGKYYICMKYIYLQSGSLPFTSVITCCTDNSLNISSRLWSLLTLFNSPAK